MHDNHPEFKSLISKTIDVKSLSVTPSKPPGMSLNGIPNYVMKNEKLGQISVWLSLFLLFLIRTSMQQQLTSFGFLFGFVAPERNAFYEIATAYPLL